MRRGSIKGLRGQWQFATGGWITAAAALGADHAVYCGSAAGRLHALDGSTGQARWIANLNSPIGHAIALSSCGLLYTLTGNGVVHALCASDGSQQKTTAP